MKFAFTIVATLLAFSSNAQSEDSIVRNWQLQAIYGLNGTQSSFVNWSSGGRNNISLLGHIEASAKYTKNNCKWSNDLGLALGGLKYVGKGTTEKLQKTDDKIDFATNLGFKMKEHWYTSLIGGFRTQFMDGFAYPNDSVSASRIMAPGYLTIALGIGYEPSEDFSVFLSPLASKMTFVQDTRLANAGAYGVDAAELDGLGNVIVAGKKFRGEFGAYLKMKYAKAIAKNIEVKTKLELFSNYLHNPQNIDVNAEAIFNFKVNSWFSASLNLNLLYDDDIDILDSNGDLGPRTQFKSVLGVGVQYTMRNFKVD